VNALRENSLARTLAEPTLVAISGQTASFLAGGEVPIPVTQGGAVAGAITIEYKEFGVRLAFTPTILGNQLMRLHVMSEVSDAVETSRVVGTLPLFTFTTRRVETTVECGNGQSFAIAGLLSDNVRAISSKIPGVGDIPVIGALFSSVEYRNDKTELVVLVTPELVAAIDPQQVVTPPGADMRQPDDFELFGLGLLEGRTAKAAVGETDSEEPTAGETAAKVKEQSLAELPLYGPWGSEESTVEYAN
jgi:pilus assembly protein CpaC